MFQVLGEDEYSSVELSRVDLGGRELLHIFRSMLTVRLLDEWLIRLNRIGKLAFHAPNAGHEAVAAVAYALEERDWVFPSHRDLALMVARGMTLDEIVSDYIISVKAPFRGRDFLQFFNKSLRIMQPPIVMATSIPLAVGFAAACKYRKRDEVVTVFFGDGASSKGDFHESANLAGVMKVPIVFFLENNQYAISMPASRQTASETFAVKAKAYGFEGLRVDGNDPLAIYLAAKEAVEKARRGGGPTLIELYTYRLGAHTTADDPARYRDPEEVKRWMEKDPLKRFKEYLLKRGVLTEEMEREMRREIDEEIRRVIEENEKLPKPPPRKVLIDDVYKHPPWFLEEEAEEIIE